MKKIFEKKNPQKSITPKFDLNTIKNDINLNNSFEPKSSLFIRNIPQLSDKNVFSKCNSNISNKYNNIFSKNVPKTNNFDPIYNSNNIVSKSYDLHSKKNFIKTNIFETNENKYNPAFPYLFVKEYPYTNENSYNIFGISKNIISEKSNIPNKDIINPFKPNTLFINNFFINFYKRKFSFIH